MFLLRLIGEHLAVGDVEMARPIRDLDWGAMPVGPIADWPQSLKTALDLILEMPGPATLLGTPPPT